MKQVSLIPGQTAIRGEAKKLTEDLAAKTVLSEKERAYLRGIRDAYLWVLNGGEPPYWPCTQRCRECGCTNDNASHCIKRTGKLCSWVSRDLCSACAEVKS